MNEAELISHMEAQHKALIASLPEEHQESAVILNIWNGRVTAYAWEPPGGIELHWMLAGHVEDVDVWLILQMTDDEMQKLSDSNMHWDEVVKDIQTPEAILSIPEAGMRVPVDVRKFGGWFG